MRMQQWRIGRERRERTSTGPCAARHQDAGHEWLRRPSRAGTLRPNSNRIRYCFRQSCSSRFRNLCSGLLTQARRRGAWERPSCESGTMCTQPRQAHHHNLQPMPTLGSASAVDTAPHLSRLRRSTGSRPAAITQFSMWTGKTTCFAKRWRASNRYYDPPASCALAAPLLSA